MLFTRFIRFFLLAALPCAAAAGTSAIQSEEVANLQDSVRIELDTHSIPTIIASYQLDAFSGQGFIHARDRFFQMDLMRRQAAGEISALIGSFAINLDRARVVLRRRELATKILSGTPRKRTGNARVLHSRGECRDRIPLHTANRIRNTRCPHHSVDSAGLHPGTDHHDRHA